VLPFRQWPWEFKFKDSSPHPSAISALRSPAHLFFGYFKEKPFRLPIGSAYRLIKKALPENLSRQGLRFG
jgi:hypothetical protein